MGNWINPECFIIKEASPTPGVSGAYGDAVKLEFDGDFVLPLYISTTTSGTFGTGETVSIRITATFSDGTTASVSKNHTAAGTIWLDSADLSTLMKDGEYIKSISVDSSSSAASTSVSTSASVYGLGK